jgi:hypothetical protein
MVLLKHTSHALSSLRAERGFGALLRSNWDAL